MWKFEWWIAKTRRNWIPKKRWFSKECIKHTAWKQCPFMTPPAPFVGIFASKIIDSLLSDVHLFIVVYTLPKIFKKNFFSWQRHYLPFPTIGKAIFRWEERNFFIHRIKCDAIQNARTHTYPREQRVRCKGEKKKRARDSNLKLDEFLRWSVGVRLFIDKHAYTMCIRCVVYFAARVAHTDENDFKKNDWRWLMTISGDDNDLCVHCTGISFSRICVGIIDAVQQTQFRIYFGPVCVCICRVHTTKLDSIFFTLACATSPEMLKTKKKKTFWWKWI